MAIQHTILIDGIGEEGGSVFVKVSRISNHLPELSILNSEIEIFAVKFSLDNN